MSVYQKRHYEDVAKILSDALPDTALCGFTITCLSNNFADLFAEDNPRTCCGHPINTPYEFCPQTGEQHKFKNGFDRERFLVACGLEPEPILCSTCGQGLSDCLTFGCFSGANDGYRPDRA